MSGMKMRFSIIVVLAFALKLSADETTNLPAATNATITATATGSPLGNLHPLFTVAASNSPALLKIGTGEADKHYDQEMIVTGKVAQVSIRPKVIFLNIDAPFSDSPFTVVIFPGKSSFFGDAKALDGKSIEIKGKIKNYHDKPEIVLDSTNQLTVIAPLDSTNAPVENYPAIR
jgi:DNA/RNA endonuclease YhcR with UshA esterase domain